MISSLFQCGSKIDTTIVCFQVSQQPAQPAKVVASPVVRTILNTAQNPVYYSGYQGYTRPTYTTSYLVPTASATQYAAYYWRNYPTLFYQWTKVTSMTSMRLGDLNEQKLPYWLFVTTPKFTIWNVTSHKQCWSCIKVTQFCNTKFWTMKEIQGQVALA